MKRKLFFSIFLVCVLIAAIGFLLQKSYHKTQLGLFIGRGLYTSQKLLFERISPPGATLSPEHAQILVMQMKDSDGVLAFQSEIAQKYQLPTGNISKADFIALISDLKRRGFYVIGYVAVFKDEAFAKRYPTEAITRENEVFTDRYGSFVDPLSQAYEKYFAELLGEVTALQDAKFDEIMLDYMRYPEYPDLIFPFTKDAPLAEREKNIAIFIERMSKLIPKNLVFSGALFPRGYGVGHNYRLLCPLFDIISPMLYPANFGIAHFNFDNDSYKKGFMALVNDTLLIQAEGCKAVIRPFVEGHYFERIGDKPKSKIYLSDELLAWQLDVVKKNNWGTIVYNSRSEYENLWRVLKLP
jgi:hypothetical protein